MAANDNIKGDGCILNDDDSTLIMFVCNFGSDQIPSIWWMDVTFCQGVRGPQRVSPYFSKRKYDVF